MQLSRDLVKHSAEFARAVRSLKFERTETGGLYFPEQRAVACGMYQDRIRRNGSVIKDWEAFPNLLPTEGLTYLLSLLEAGTKLPSWYLALYAGAITPVSTWTGANFATNASEITSGTEGYTQTNRVTWVPGTAAAAAVNNNSSAASFTIATATTLVVNGVGMLSTAAKGDATGKLLSAARLPSARSFANTDSYDVKYGITLTST